MSLLVLGMVSAMAGDGEISGHVGLVVPLAAVSTGSGVSTIADQMAFGMPIGFGKALSERVAFDLEFVPLVAGETLDLVVHPGAIFKLGGGVALGTRAAFEVSSNAVGATLLVNKGFPNGFFVEGVVPLRTVSVDGERTNLAAFALHSGFGF